MRFEQRFSGGPQSARAMGIRLIERPGVVADPLCPIDWPAARVEAWLDWNDAQPIGADPTPDLEHLTENALMALDGGPALYAGALAARGLALGLFADPGEAPRELEMVGTIPRSVASHMRFLRRPRRALRRRRF